MIGANRSPVPSIPGNITIVSKTFPSIWKPDRFNSATLVMTHKKTRHDCRVFHYRQVGYGLKLASLRSITVLQAAGVVISRFPDAVAWLLSQVAVDPFHFTYLYWTDVFGGKVTVPLHGTFAPLPWIVKPNAPAGA